MKHDVGIERPFVTFSSGTLRRGTNFDGSPATYIVNTANRLRCHRCSRNMQFGWTVGQIFYCESCVDTQ